MHEPHINMPDKPLRDMPMTGSCMPAPPMYMTTREAFKLCTATLSQDKLPWILPASA
jgi:hypothetical protein